jgi:hypothetical protein
MLDEDNRLAILRSYNILKHGNLASYDKLLELAMCMTGATMGAICLLEANTLVHKSVKDIPVSEMESIYPLSRLVLESTDRNQLVHVRDPDQIREICSKEELIHKNSSLVSILDDFIGIPLHAHVDDAILGTLCLMNSDNLVLTDRQVNSLICLGEQIVTHFDLHRAILEIDNQRQEIDRLKAKKVDLLEQAKSIASECALNPKN